MTTNTDRALALLDIADARIEDADAIRAAIVELVERINAGLIDPASRADLGGDMIAAAERLHGYALAVIG